MGMTLCNNMCIKKYFICIFKKSMKLYNYRNSYKIFYCLIGMPPGMPPIGRGGPPMGPPGMRGPPPGLMRGGPPRPY